MVFACVLFLPAALKAQEKKESPSLQKIQAASVQIINATSLPLVSLSINEKEGYPQFPQGLYTSDAPLPGLNPQYLLVDPLTHLSARFQAKLSPDSNQSLVILGDFVVPEDPSLYFPGVLSKPVPSGPKKQAAKRSGPNILFLVFDHSLPKDSFPLRYRLINGMPGTPLLFNKGQEDQLTIEPGNYQELYSQKPIMTLKFTVGNKAYPVLINQQGMERNALIIFYKTPAGPAFMRVFENTREMLEKLVRSEADSG